MKTERVATHEEWAILRAKVPPHGLDMFDRGEVRVFADKAGLHRILPPGSTATKAYAPKVAPAAPPAPPPPPPKRDAGAEFMERVKALSGEQPVPLTGNAGADFLAKVLAMGGK